MDRLPDPANERETAGEAASPEKPADPRPGERDDERADREAEETFPASDPPANY